MDAFHEKCLRRLLGTRWYHRVPNGEVYNGQVMLHCLIFFLTDASLSLEGARESQIFSIHEFSGMNVMQLLGKERLRHVQISTVLTCCIRERHVDSNDGHGC